MEIAALVSGGVDSSVVVHQLKEAGYDPTIFYIRIGMEDKDGYIDCPAEEDIEITSYIARKYGCRFEIVSLHDEYWDRVVSYTIESVKRGLTPNPDMMCNKYIKFGCFEEKWGKDFDKIATGHYARIEKLPNGRYALKKSVTAAKDQTYALYNLTQDQLAHTLMPVGSYTKDQIREIAEEIGIPVAHKPDSQEICFIPDHDYAKYIRENTDTELPPGNFVDLDGNILGKHLGITHYTVGQRKGLNLSMGKPVFVVEIRPETNEVVIGDSKDVFSDHLTCDHVNWMSVDGLHGETMKVTAKIRYSHKGAPCEIREIGPDLVEVQFKEPQRAITPGQAVVFYDGDYVVGGGVIR